MPLHSCFSFYQNAPSFKVILCKVRSFPRELLKSSFSLHSYPHNSVNAFSSDIVLDAPSPTVWKKALPGQAPCLCHAVPPCANRDRVMLYPHVPTRIVTHLPFVFFCFAHCEAYGLLAPWPGIEPRPLHWECRVLTTGPLGKSHTLTF